MGAACYRFEVLAKLINDVKPITNPVCCAVFSISLPPLAGRARVHSGHAVRLIKRRQLYLIFFEGEFHEGFCG